MALPPRPRKAGAASRTEHDLLGERQVPAAAYYGVQTLRAIENFRISGVPIAHYPQLIAAFAYVKKAAARANHDSDPEAMPRDVLGAIDAACDELIAGKLLDQFPVDLFQGGAGTSTNMNANEVIANRALEHLGKPRGSYDIVDPHDHVNLAQSTNDAYPTALKLSVVLAARTLIPQLEALVAAFAAKGREFSGIVKMGRTQLQDAVPMTLGQEFTAFAQTIADEVKAMRAVGGALCEVNMGGTAIGTGLNAPRGYARRCARHLAEVTGLPIRLAADLVEATQDTQAYVMASSALKSVAIKLSKVCNDLRLLASGPRCGLQEIRLPAKQPGSSIMPGKVNPVIPEVVNQVCFKVIGNDLAVTLAAEAGQLQLNVMEPVIAQCLHESIALLREASRTLRVECVEGIEADADRCRWFVENSIGLVTALNPLIGYDRATELAAEALRSGKGIIELVREKGIMSEREIARALDPKAMTAASPPRRRAAGRTRR
ncbi:MAG TPA: aspartate ammonia-lyase [Phycisphaerales bacterium]|nr:aspartate ammonia-lyase [Phycisphaerales bacterium]HMP37331.1 aspartate ammonia-lyase [Phycisphaerales bacterium]